MALDYGHPINMLLVIACGKSSILPSMSFYCYINIIIVCSHSTAYYDIKVVATLDGMLAR